MLKRIALFSFIVFNFLLEAVAQPVNYDYVYYPNIKTLQVFVNGTYQHVPTIELNGNSVFKINWDDIDGDRKFFKYQLVHCDKYWNPSTEIVTTDYLRGFNDELVEYSELSINTEVFYTYYELYLPNSRTQFVLPGNYLLHVYENDPNDPIFTKRLIVVNTSATIEIGMIPSSDVSEYATHQEIVLDVYSDLINIRNPMMELSVVVLQNGDWMTAIGPEPPHRLGTAQGYAIYDKRGQFSFPGRNEFRFFDMRSLRSRREGLQNIRMTRDAVYVSLWPSTVRRNIKAAFRTDFNGLFTIDNYDSPRKEISAKYAQTQFELANSPFLQSKDIYVRGSFSEWQCYPENKMTYDPNTDSYFVDILLKQGFYEYEFVEEFFDSEGKPTHTHEVTEGNQRETENDYNVIIYYRPIGERYDSVIKVSSINSLDTGAKFVK